MRLPLNIIGSRSAYFVRSRATGESNHCLQIPYSYIFLRSSHHALCALSFPPVSPHLSSYDFGKEMLIGFFCSAFFQGIAQDVYLAFQSNMKPLALDVPHRFPNPDGICPTEDYLRYRSRIPSNSQHRRIVREAK